MIWNKTYDGGWSQEGAYNVIQTSDGGYALLGLTESLGAGYLDFWLVKTDANGNMIWNKAYGGPGRDWADAGHRVLIQTNDGGFALAGNTDSFGAGRDDFWLVKTDSSGNMQWNRTYGGAGIDQSFSLIQTCDGGYVMVGYTESFGAGGKDFWLLKTSAESGLAWTDSTANSITLQRGVTDGYWNFVRVRIWKMK